MDDDRREFMRFPVSLPVEFVYGNEETKLGLIRDFSRFGFRMVYDSCEFEPNSLVSFKIKNPFSERYIDACGEVIWKRFLGEKWEAGIYIREFAPEYKAEILEFGFNQWKERNRRPAHN